MAAESWMIGCGETVKALDLWSQSGCKGLCLHYIDCGIWYRKGECISCGYGKDTNTEALSLEGFNVFLGLSSWPGAG